MHTHTPILTYARIRPALKREISQNRLNRCVAQQPDRPVLHVATKPGSPIVIEADGSTNSPDVRTFELDGVFDETTDTLSVYSKCAQPLVDGVLSGVNATIMSYGMTGSGKTHTMFGDESGDGVVGLSARQLVAAASATGADVSIEVSFMQLYGTLATDLLLADSPPLKMARRDNEVVVDGQSRRAVTSPRDMAAIVAEGVARRKVASQKLNSASSRSHAVLTFHVSTSEMTADENTLAVSCTKLVCVDLAGSERVKESGVEGVALREAQAINLSLFHLVRVVQALNECAATPSNGQNRQGTKGAATRVPYADSPLTLLLSDALGGNSRTAIVATLSPAQEHAIQTAGTCSFAAACRLVRNGACRVSPRRVPRHRPWAGADASAEAAQRRQADRREAGAAAKSLPWAGVSPGDAERCPGGRREICGISCLVYGDAAAATRGPALALHGNPSDAEAMCWLAPALVHAGYFVVCVDMPGFGATPPPTKGRMATRSEQACEAGGPAEVVESVLRALGAKSCCLVGYDWGAGVALAMASSSKYRRLVDSICCMHPAFATERVQDELKSVQAATLILWAEDNAFHSWSKFKPLAAKLRGRLGKRYSEHRARRETDLAWSAAARTRAIVAFLTGLDPLPEAQTVATRPERATTAADGASITRMDGVVFRGDVTEEMVRGADTEALACASLVRAERSGELAGMLRDLARPGGSARASVMSAFARALPPLDAASMTPSRLEALGLWSSAAREGAEALQARVMGSPRYFVGRRVLLPGGSTATSCADRQGSLRGVDERADRAVVEVDGVDRFVSWRALLLLNQRHVLPSTTNSGGGTVLRLEDGMWANLDSPLLRTELARMALALGRVFEREMVTALANGGDDVDGALDAARGKAVVAMRRCLDLTSFAREGGADRGRDRQRYAKDDVAKMGAHGEGHCRTCSSTFAPFLWAFSELLCIDPHYCTDSAGTHQWLQFDARPSMRSFVCDIYRDENAKALGAAAGSLLAQPVEAAYCMDTEEGWLFPHDEPLELTGRRVALAPLEPTDVWGLSADGSQLARAQQEGIRYS